MNTLINSEAKTPSSSQSQDLKSRLKAVLSIAKNVGGTTLGKRLAKQWKGKLALSLAGIVGVATPAQALNFNITYAPGTTQQQKEAVELAAGIWSSYLTDDVTVNFHFEMTNEQLATTALAGATPAITTNINYSDFRSAAITEANSAGQTLFLPQSDSYNQRLQDGTLKNNSQMMLTSANAKALLIDINRQSLLDGYIQLSSSVNWDYNYNASTINQNSYDFVSVILHEMGHNLGFISGLDQSNLQNQATALDLFRYSSESTAVGAIDFSIGVKPYFSLDGGQTLFGIDLDGNQIIDSTEQAYFAKGEDLSLGGDGYQTSHWKRSPNTALGIMDPVLSKGKVRSLSQFDLSLLDTIGWNVNYQAQTDLTVLQSQATVKAKNAVTVDRSQEVKQMLDESGVYNIRWTRSSGFWQTADSSETSTANVQSVPEPNSTLGLLTLVGVAGIGAALKRR